MARTAHKTIYQYCDDFGFDMEIEVDEYYDVICVIIEGTRLPKLKDHGWVKALVSSYIEEHEGHSSDCGHDQYMDLNVQ